MWDDFEALKIYFQRRGGFWLEMCGFCKDYEAFKSYFQRSGGFLKLIWRFYKDNEAFWNLPVKWRLLFRNVGLL
jgi:hypothetical protein